MNVETAYRRSVEAWIKAVNGTADSWHDATPCDDWDVRQLVNHVVGEDRWTKPMVDGKTIAEVGSSLDGDLLGADPVGAAVAAADEAVDAVAVRLPGGGLVHLSYGDEQIEEYVRQLIADHLIHGWDLAAATGQSRRLDPELVSAVGAWYREREDIYRGAGAVAARPASARGGSPEDDLLIAFGRDPQWAGPTD